MKILKKVFMHQKITFNILLLLLISLNINLIQSIGVCDDCVIINNKCVKQNDDDNCDSKCRPHLYGGVECYDCSSVLDSNNIYYYINVGGTTPQCEPKTNCDLITIENNECVDDCGSGYILEMNIEGTTYTRCTSSCPSGYFDLRTKKCVNECKGSTDKITEDNGCTDYCSSNQYLFTQTERINGVTVTKKYCLSTCPEQKRYYYESSFQDNECVSSCNEGDFYSVTTEPPYKCVSSCDKMLFIDPTNNIYQCSDKSKPSQANQHVCPDSFPYQYKDYCLRNCKVTEELELFNKKKTYYLSYKDSNDKIKKFCSEDCSEDPIVSGDSSKNFYDSTTLSCHIKCDETSDKYYFGNECLSQCDTTHPFHLIDDGRCVVKCSDANQEDPSNPGNYIINYYLLRAENACYKDKCPMESDYKYINIKNDYQDCTTCKIPKNPGFIDYGEGYIIEKTETSEKILYCYDSCQDALQSGETDNYYYNNNDNKCLELVQGCEGNNGEYKYSDGVTNSHICYKSCKEISNEHTFQYGYKCFKQKQTTDTVDNDFKTESNVFHYYIKSGIKIYIKSSELSTIFKLNLFYKRKVSGDADNPPIEYECVNDCNPGEYRKLFSGESGTNTLGECLTGCIGNFKYYSEKEKICRDSCPYKTLKTVTIDSNPPQINEITDGENCLKECPSNYYESEDGISCYDKCPKKYYYITKDGKKNV